MRWEGGTLNCCVYKRIAEEGGGSIYYLYMLLTLYLLQVSILCVCGLPRISRRDLTLARHQTKGIYSINQSICTLYTLINLSWFLFNSIKMTMPHMSNLYPSHCHVLLKKISLNVLPLVNYLMAICDSLKFVDCVLAGVGRRSGHLG